MLFNSFEFLVFAIVVFALYWSASKKNILIQNILIVLASYLFYGWWDWRFLSLILFSSTLDFLIGIKLKNTEEKKVRKLLLYLSLLLNLGFLGFFKYYNFFIDNFISAFSNLGFNLDYHTLKIILPVGISFYTFQTLSYTIDVYRKKLEPTNNYITFLAFVSFFPQLVAGPIERAKNLLPQFLKRRKFDYDIAIDGLRQILWGLFKKVVIADTCAQYANQIFNNSPDYSGSTLVIGAVFFAFQIYGDFSGYSDIAIGLAKLFGFDLKINFSYPYFSRDIAEFWRRWHISLSTWFRDYLYIPLGGSRVNTSRKIFNTLVIFTVSGFWHGANWTFIIWGLLNGLYFLPLILTKKNRKHIEIVAHNKMIPNFRELIGIATTFFLTTIAWIFFRAENLQHAVNFISKIFSESLLSTPEVRPRPVFYLLFIFVLIEWVGRKYIHPLQTLNVFKIPIILKWSIYLILICTVFYYSGAKQEFIYFQF